MDKNELAGLLVAWIDDLRHLEREGNDRGGGWAEVKARKVADQMLEVLTRCDPLGLVQRYGKDFE